MICQDYVSPSSIEEALATLASLRGKGRVIAGGTDLMIHLQRRQLILECLVDITSIPGLDEIHEENSHVVVGAAVTFSQIEGSALIRDRASVLAEAASKVGSPQIRNVGTLAGNVVNAQPAADGSIALLALDAEAEIANLTGRQWVPVATLFVRPGISRVDATAEMITAFRFRASGPKESSAFERLARRRALALPLINVGVNVLLTADGARFRDVRIAIGPVAPVPFRAREAEEALTNQPLNRDTIDQAAEIAVRESKPRTSLLRASKEYRRELIGVLTKPALLKAIGRARG